MGGIVRRSLSLAALFVLVCAFPVSAQDAATTWSLEATVGIGGFIDPHADTVVDVTISSDLLLVGRIDLNAGGSTASEAIEVPAGGVKNLRLEGAPVRDRRLVTVRLFDTSGDEPVELESQQLRVTVPLRQIVVGLVGAESAEPGLRSATPEPIDFDVELVRMDGSDVGRGLAVLDYLVVGGGALAQQSHETVSAVRRWVSDGGVLVGSARDVDPVSDPSSGTVWPGTAVTMLRIGDGEVAAVTDIGTVTTDEWSVLLRGNSNPGLTRNPGFGQGPGLISAASVGREASVPGLSWLLGGIVLFVVLVGPANFLILRRMKRPELAWFTVPALSLLFVAGFWLAGRAQVADAAVTSAAVLIEADGEVTGTAGAVVQVAASGERTLSFPDGYTITPSEGFGFASGVRDSDDAASVTFTLEDLGVGAAEARITEADSIAVRIEIGADGAAEVTNNTDYTFWSWGLVVDGVGFTVSTRSEDLEPGHVEQITVSQRRRTSRFEPVILETAQRRAVSDPTFYETTYQVLNALAYEAETLDQRTTREGTYFFGFTDSIDAGVSVDGKSIDAAGSTLLIKEFELPAELRSGAPVIPKLLEVEGSATVEQYGDEIYAFGAESVWLRYEVPEGAAGGGVIRPAFTQLQVVQVFDWTTREFGTYEWGDELDLGAVVSPGGDLVVRASLEETTEFFEESLQLSFFELTWSET